MYNFRYTANVLVTFSSVSTLQLRLQSLLSWKARYESMACSEHFLLYE